MLRLTGTRLLSHPRSARLSVPRALAPSRARVTVPTAAILAAASPENMVRLLVLASKDSPELEVLQRLPAGVNVVAIGKNREVSVRDG